MDSHTLRILELDQVRTMLASCATSSPGKEQAASLEPSTNPAWIRSALAETSEMRAVLDEGLAPPLGGLHDVRQLVSRAAAGSILACDELVQVLDTLHCSGRMYNFLEGLAERYTALRTHARQIANLRELCRQIDSCIDDKGELRDDASPLLRSLRRQVMAVRQTMRDRIQQFMGLADVKPYLQYSQHSISGERLVVAVQSVHKAKVPGIVHRTSDSGATIYIEPTELVGLGNELTEKAEAEREEVLRILRELSGAVGLRAEDILQTVTVLAHLDLLYAKAALSRSLKMVAPEINEQGPLRLKAARHPLLEWIIRNRQPDAPPGPDHVVPIDVRLGDTFDMLVVTGPNTGGKTVALKTVGLLCLMAQCGLHVPAENATLPCFGQVFADIGDEQSLQQSLSTFSSHMSRIVQVLRQADQNSLVLLDELGAGTDPTEGAALGRSILEELRQRGCLCIVTTHLGALKLYPYRTTRAENACVEFDVETLRPTYRLLIGEAGESNALVIAQRLGLPRHVIGRAKGYIQRRKDLEQVIGEIQESRREAEQQREAAEQAQREAAQAQEQFEQAKREIEEKARKFLPPEAMLPFQVGDEVYLERFNRVGELIRIDMRKKTATVAMGQVEAQVSFDELRPASDAPQNKPGKRRYT